MKLDLYMEEVGVFFFKPFDVSPRDGTFRVFHKFSNHGISWKPLVKSLIDGRNRGFDQASLRKLSIKSSLARCVL